MNIETETTTTESRMTHVYRVYWTWTSDTGFSSEDGSAEIEASSEADAIQKAECEWTWASGGSGEITDCEPVS